MPDTAKPAKLPVWPWIVGLLIIVVFVAVVLYLVFVPKPDVWTDDATVSAHYAMVAPRVSGQVIAVAADDNEAVTAGQTLVRLDPRDFEVSVQRAQAAIERDTAQVGNASANVARQPALITEQDATVAQMQARLCLALADQRRYSNLAATGAGTGQQRQQADAAVAEDRASLAGAQASLQAAHRQLDVLRAQVASGQGNVGVDRAALAQAQLDLGYATIVAPLDGVIGERSVQVGDYVAAGTTLMVAVPLDQVFVVANYREVALRHVRIGQHVTIHVDAYDIDLDGVVDSLPPASGATFSAIPPQNATGNYTRIVQRLPVKIVLSPHQPRAALLKLGFSVETTIHTGLADVATGDTDPSVVR